MAVCSRTGMHGFYRAPITVFGSQAPLSQGPNTAQHHPGQQARLAPWSPNCSPPTLACGQLQVVATLHHI